HLETTAGPPTADAVTVVGLYGNGRMTSLVQGESLTEHRLNQELANYDLVVTFFGSRFDLPYLRATFPGVVLDHPHLDLCFAARRLGLDGGLKHIEGRMGIRGARAFQAWAGWTGSGSGTPGAMEEGLGGTGWLGTTGGGRGQSIGGGVHHGTGQKTGRHRQLVSGWASLD